MTVDAMQRLALTHGSVECRVIAGDPSRSAVVMLHEGLGSVAGWKTFPQMIANASGRTVVVYSRYGYGFSDPAELPRSPRYMHLEALHVLPELLAELGIVNPVLLGHSDGASIAAIYASEHPVDRLVLIAPHVFVEDRTLAGIRSAQRSFASGDLLRKLAIIHQYPNTVFESWSDVWLSEDFRDWVITDRLGAITAPILAIQGNSDAYGSFAHTDAIASEVRAGQLALMAGDWGHFPHADRPHEVVSAVVDFMG